MWLYSVIPGLPWLTILRCLTPIWLYLLYSLWHAMWDSREHAAAEILRSHADFNDDMLAKEERCLYCNGASDLGAALKGSGVEMVCLIAPGIRCIGHRSECARVEVQMPRRAWAHAVLYAEKTRVSKNSGGKAYTPFDGRGAEEKAVSTWTPTTNERAYSNRFRVYKQLMLIHSCNPALLYEKGDLKGQAQDWWFPFRFSAAVWRRSCCLAARHLRLIVGMCTRCGPATVRMCDTIRHHTARCVQLCGLTLSFCRCPRRDDDGVDAGGAAGGGDDGGDIEMGVRGDDGRGLNMFFREETPLESLARSLRVAEDVRNAMLAPGDEELPSTSLSPTIIGRPAGLNSSARRWLDEEAPAPEAGTTALLQDAAAGNAAMSSVVITLPPLPPPADTFMREQYHEPLAPVLGAVYPSVPLVRGPHWMEFDVETKEKVKQALDVKARVRQAVEAGENLKQALDRYGIIAQARVTAPISKDEVFYIADAHAPENVRNALDTRHFTDTEPFVYDAAQLARCKRIAGRLGAKLATAYGIAGKADDIRRVMPSTWAEASKESAVEQAVSILSCGDRKKAARLLKRFFPKANECLSKAKVRGIMGENKSLGNGVTAMHAIVAAAVEDAFATSGLNDRTIKHATPSEVEKRLNKLLGGKPGDYYAVSADYGSFDSTMRTQLRQNTEQEFLESFCQCLGFEPFDFDEVRKADRNKTQLRFSCAVSNVITTEFGRSSGDRFTSIGNFIINLVMHLAFLETEGLDVDRYLDYAIAGSDDGQQEGELQSLFYTMMEGDDNLLLLLKQWIDARGGEGFYTRQREWFKRLGTKWEPMSDDDSVVEADGSKWRDAYRSADSRIEFTSKHFVFDDELGRFVSFPKLKKSLTTSMVTFSTLNASKFDLIGSMADQLMFLSASCPILYEYYAALQRIAGTPGLAKDYASTVGTGYIGRTLEAQRKDMCLNSFAEMIARERERTCFSQHDVKKYILRNYQGFTDEVYEQVVFALRSCSDWDELGRLRKQILACASVKYVCPDQQPSAHTSGPCADLRPAGGLTSPTGPNDGILSSDGDGSGGEEPSSPAVSEGVADTLPNTPEASCAQLLMSGGVLSPVGQEPRKSRDPQDEVVPSAQPGDAPSPRICMSTQSASTFHCPTIVNNSGAPSSAERWLSGETVEGGQLRQSDHPGVGAGNGASSTQVGMKRTEAERSAETLPVPLERVRVSLYDCLGYGTLDVEASRSCLVLTATRPPVHVAAPCGAR